MRLHEMQNNGENMKIYIVFLGIFLVSVMGLSYQGDLGAYIHEEMVLKEAAEECAAGASLFLEEEAFAEGLIVFKYEEGRSYAAKYLEYIKRNSKALKNGTVDWSMSFEDDMQGYEKTNGKRIPAVSVKIRVTTSEDMFRVPFINVNSLERSARYELPREEETL